MNQETDNSQNQIPKWAAASFSKFLDETEQTSRLMHLSMHGIGVLRAMPDLYEVLKDLDADGYEENRHNEAKREAELANREVEMDFPLLRSQTSVTIWTLLEAMVRSFLVALLENEASARQVDEIQDLKIRFGEYEQRNGSDRYFYIVELLEQQTAARIRYGVDRFESMLRVFDFSGPLPDKLRTAMYEWGQVRNAIVHKAGVTDSYLLSACPWLPYKLGDNVVVNREMVDRYTSAAISYASLVMCRVGRRYGKNMDKFHDNFIKKWA